jgi:hypothetical protein
VKYYLYVSDTKLDMLYAQIPRPVLERLAVELKVDLKVLGVVLRTNPLEDETRYSKLEVVAKYLEREGYVGTIDEPAAYFKGPVTMTWGVHGQAVYFTGEAAGTVVALAGSLGHVVGATQEQSLPMSSLPTLVMDLLAGEVGSDAMADAMSEIAEGGDRWAGQILFFHKEFTSMSSFPQQNVDFIARRLSYRTRDPEHGIIDRNVLLGTPVYVAAAS